jgi:hypothetical protein
MSSASAYFAEQRRKQAEVEVHFLLVTLSLCKQRKVTRLGAKRTLAIKQELEEENQSAVTE